MRWSGMRALVAARPGKPARGAACFCARALNALFWDGDFLLGWSTPGFKLSGRLGFFCWGSCILISVAINHPVPRIF